MSTKNITISLPTDMARKVDLAMKLEHRTRSELVREALRLFFGRRVAADIASREEITAMARARQEHARGDSITLDQLFNELGTLHRAKRKKTA